MVIPTAKCLAQFGGADDRGSKDDEASLERRRDCGSARDGRASLGTAFRPGSGRRHRDRPGRQSSGGSWAFLSNVQSAGAVSRDTWHAAVAVSGVARARGRRLRQSLLRLPLPWLPICWVCVSVLRISCRRGLSRLGLGLACRLGLAWWLGMATRLRLAWRWGLARRLAPPENLVEAGAHAEDRATF